MQQVFIRIFHKTFDAIFCPVSNAEFDVFGNGFRDLNNHGLNNFRAFRVKLPKRSAFIKARLQKPSGGVFDFFSTIDIAFMNLEFARHKFLVRAHHALNRDRPDSELLTALGLKHDRHQALIIVKFRENADIGLNIAIIGIDIFH